MPDRTSETRALQTLGLLTRGALHEISNPLVGLVGSAELALTEAQPDTNLRNRITLIHRTGVEIAGIVRALQGFIHLQDAPVKPVSLGETAAQVISLVDLVQPTHDVTLAAEGDATVIASPGEICCSLVDLLLAALASSDAHRTITLTVRTEDDEVVVTATGGGELRLPSAEAAP